MLRKDGQFNHYEPPYVADVPGGPILLILPNSYPTVYELNVYERKVGENEDIPFWPGLSGDSVKLPLGSKLRPLEGSQAGFWYTFRMYRGLATMIPDRWAQYYV